MLVAFTLGIIYMLFGVSAFTVNKYPRKETILKRMQKKHGKIDEKKLSKFQGLHYFFVGGIFIIIGIIINDIKHISFTWIISFLLLCLFFDIIYHPLRRKYLGIK